MARPTVTPDKPINLEQLTAELGGAGLCRDDETGEIVAAEGADVTQQQLEDAVAAHTAVFPPSKDDRLAAIRTKVESLPQNNPARGIFLDLIDTV